MARKRRNAGNLELIGGRLCLDFANTFTRTEGLSHEYLHLYSDLVTWSRHVGLLSDTEAENLRQQAARSPVEAAAALAQALSVRETIYRVFSAVAHHQAPAPADVANLNGVLAQAPGHMQIVASGADFEWQLVQNPDALNSMLWPIVWSAADLLTSTDLHRVRQCARREGCDWLFVDTSKNQSRRWCGMNLCGSRIKSRKYYERKHQIGPGKSEI
jgi:predicted RNA-binding Zn ribbon-like protein